MLRNMLATASAVALCLTSVTPLAAQEVRDDAPRGATATLNLRIPLGSSRLADRPSFGLTAGYGQATGAPGSDGRVAVRQWRVADLRFDGRGLRRAELATFDLANLAGDPRLGFQDGDDSDDDTLTYILVALAAAAAGVGAEMLIDDSDEESESPDETPGATSPGVG
ncbi:MAG: hypothetical protein ACXWUX_08825 [Allosphingosinicella sp.]